eukprot:scaffold88727_cov14-Prasinocladus_malaysianus.AAC.1
MFNPEPYTNSAQSIDPGLSILGPRHPSLTCHHYYNLGLVLTVMMEVWLRVLHRDVAGFMAALSASALGRMSNFHETPTADSVQHNFVHRN